MADLSNDEQPGAVPPIPPAPSIQPPATTPPAPPAPPEAPSDFAPNAYAPTTASQPIPGRTLGIVALIVAFFFQLLGLILGIVALVQSKRAGAKNTPAVWAIVVSIVLGVLGAIIAIVVIAQTAAFLAQCQGLDPGTYNLDTGGTITCS